jgi:hypothetical protein
MRLLRIMRLVKNVIDVRRASMLSALTIPAPRRVSSSVMIVSVNLRRKWMLRSMTTLS